MHQSPTLSKNSNLETETVCKINFVPSKINQDFTDIPTRFFYFRS